MEDQPTPWQYSLFHATPMAAALADAPARGADQWGRACTTVGIPWATPAEPEAEAA